MNGAINIVISNAFADVATPGLIAAAGELAALTGQLQQLQKTIADVNRFLDVADAVVSAATKVIEIAAAV